MSKKRAAIVIGLLGIAAFGIWAFMRVQFGVAGGAVAPLLTIPIAWVVAHRTYGWVFEEDEKEYRATMARLDQMRSEWESKR